MKRKAKYKYSKNSTGHLTNNKLIYITLAFILLIAFIVYYSAIKNGFVYDDEHYIVNNKLIRNLSWEGIKSIFMNFGSDNYAPITDIINAVQYKISGLNPVTFHIGSLIFHLLNIVLVFWFIKLISARWEIAAVTAIFFAIHPLQVESIAWISAGSNLFCAVFFLSSLIAYLYYLKNRLKRYYLISILFFIFSVLSKAIAVMLPLVLLLIDYYKNRNITVKILFEKIPFLIFSIGLGILALILKNNTIELLDLAIYTFPQRIIIACYGFITYLVKLILPLNLSVFYPYPDNFSIKYFAYIFHFILLIALIFYSRRFSKKIIFGLGFYAINILIVLQIFTVGGTIIADRYSYLPSIGVFYLTAEGLFILWNKKYKIISIGLLSVLIVFFYSKTSARCVIWENDNSLWSNVIEHYPKVSRAYYSKGLFYMRAKRYDDALNEYNKAIELNPEFVKAYINRGIILRDNKNYDASLSDFNKAVELDTNQVKAYFNRGLQFTNTNKFDMALTDYNLAINKDPYYFEAYIARGNLFYIKKMYDSALSDYNKAAELNPKNIESHLGCGNVFYVEKKYNQAINSYSKVIGLNQNYAYAFYLKGMAEYNLGDTISACVDLKQSVNLGYKPAEDVIKKICN